MLQVGDVLLRVGALRAATPRDLLLLQRVHEGMFVGVISVANEEQREEDERHNRVEVIDAGPFEGGLAEKA